MRFYDPKTNIFGVFDADGTPRTIFKPRAREKYFLNQIKKYLAEGGKVINELPEKPIANINRGRNRNRGGGGNSGGGGLNSIPIAPRGGGGIGNFRILPFVNL
jgi:hypothetical protein